MLVPESITAGTDVLLGLAGLWFSLAARQAKLWCAAFAASAAAAFVGAVFHGVGGQGAVLAPWHGGLWDAILLLIGLSAGLTLAAVFSRPLPRTAVRTRWILAGAGLSALGLAVQQSRLGAGNLDHNSLYHLIQIAALYGFFRAARRDQARAPSS